MSRPVSVSIFAFAACVGLALPIRAADALQIRKAVFSDRQLFWPQLEGKGGAENPGAAGKHAHPKTDPASAHIAVLPLRIRDYSESIPCDSCHRLSANGMEFFLENYLKDRMQARFAGKTVDLIAPQTPLVEKRVDLLAYLDSLVLPWDKWLADSSGEVVYRPRDRFTSAPARKRLDRLGGMLGATHLLVPADVRVKVTPRASNGHTGGLDWGFKLVFWNVAQGSPEWALSYSESVSSMDLDESLEGRLDKALGAAWDGMPSELSALWSAEPH